jgi:SAM-dependent methyltransferase
LFSLALYREVLTIGKETDEMRPRKLIYVLAFVMTVNTALALESSASQVQTAGVARPQSDTRQSGPSGAVTQPEAGTRYRQPDVIYVPTPRAVIDEMLRIAKVRADDVIYDLGCGDGRIVITAAQEYGARGIGIDIDPQRIREANENARQAGVTDRVRFLNEDLFEADISQATVVTLYLLESLNEKLRPKLLRELRPGTRIVSHDFKMGDWEPEQAIEMNGHRVYFWTVPARGEAPTKARTKAK